MNIKQSHHSDPLLDMGQFIQRLQKTDNKYKRLFLFAFLINFFVFAAQVIHLVSALLEGWIPQDWSIAVDIIAYIVILIPLYQGYKKYNNADYSIPVLSMLKQTLKRHRFASNKEFGLVLLFIFLKIAAEIIKVPNITEATRAIIMLSVALLVGITVGIILWYITSRPLFINAKKMIIELES
ncbi:MAG: hypothetical protein N4A37_13905 [Prolixibacteraceae bacterium]|jgi:uncharacterized membrane protein|nr:hypothetical protein [Prolixibacteraceae bacterium]